MPTEFVAFLAVAIVVIVTPGQDTALTIQSTLRGGRRGGVFAACGVVSGLAVWTVATSLGLAALLLASEPIFVALKFAGAAYLIYLGAHALYAALRPGAAYSSSLAERSARPLPPSAAYRRGLLSNLGNPKIAVFFSSLLPQFTPDGETSFFTLLFLGLVFCAITLVWLTGYAVAIAKAGAWLSRSRVRRALDGVTGTVFVAFGLRLASSHRA